MIPNIFISSTISDLHHLRDAVRDTIQELRYNPRMSDFGDLGYLPNQSAEESCYQSVRECQLFILIIGKKYGSLGKNQLSITHNEFQTAKQLRIPVICLIDHDVHAFRQIYEANAAKTTIYPGMDAPEMTFKLIQEFSGYPENNGYLIYKNMFEARDHIKNQLAHIFCDLITKRHDSVRSEIKDVLAEITTLRHVLLKDEEDQAKKFTKATRILLDEKFKALKEFGDRVLDGIENLIPIIIKHKDLTSICKSQNIKLIITNEINDRKKLDKTFSEGATMSMVRMLPLPSFGEEPFIDIKIKEGEDNKLIYSLGKNKIWVNENGLLFFDALINKFKENLK